MTFAKDTLDNLENSEPYAELPKLDADLLEKLHMEDPYEEFDETQHPEDLQTWNSDGGNFQRMVDEYKPDLLVEIGSWKGASAISLAQMMKPDSLVIAVDTWLGSIEHREHKGHYYDSYRMKNGYPQLYYTFLGNVKRAGLRHKVLPFPNGSLIAARWFAANNLQPDLVYIDGSHDFEDVFLDLNHWYDIIKTGGAVFGDDFGWPSVRTALETFRRINNIHFEVQSCNNQWVMRKHEAKKPIQLDKILSRDFYVYDE